MHADGGLIALDRVLSRAPGLTLSAWQISPGMVVCPLLVTVECVNAARKESYFPKFHSLPIMPYPPACGTGFRRRLTCGGLIAAAFGLALAKPLAGHLPLVGAAEFPPAHRSAAMMTPHPDVAAVVAIDGQLGVGQVGLASFPW